MVGSFQRGPYLRQFFGKSDVANFEIGIAARGGDKAVSGDIVFAILECTFRFPPDVFFVCDQRNAIGRIKGFPIETGNSRWGTL